MKEEVILTILPHQLREVLKRENIDFQSIQEIRLRVGKPLILLYRGNEVIPKADGRPYYITKDEIREMLDYISGYSLYSYEREMSQGYITIEGGHRVGLSGQAIMENGKVKNLKYISSINVRMSHEILGCADGLFSYAFASSRQNLIHILMLAIMTAVFTNFARAFGNGQAADTGFYVMYLLIVALCLNSCQIIMDWVEAGISNLIQFMTVFGPIYFPAVAVAKGSVTAISFYSLTLFLVYLVEMFLKYVVLPAIHIYILVSMLNYLTKESYLSKLAELIKTVLVWIMKTILAGVVGLNLVQSLLSPAMDTVKRSALTRGTEAIPGIGDAIGGVTEVIFASAVLVKNGIGVVGAIICFALCLMPIVQIGAIALLYKLAAALMQPVSDVRIIGCMETVGEGMRLLIRAVFTVGMLFLITIILVAASTGTT